MGSDRVTIGGIQTHGSITLDEETLSTIVRAAEKAVESGKHDDVRYLRALLNLNVAARECQVELMRKRIGVG